MTVSCHGDARRPVVAPVEERVGDHALGHERGAVERRSARSRGRRRGRGRPPRSTARAPRSPWRRGRAAAWRGCSAGRRRGPTARAPGSRSAARGRRWAGSRASRGRSPRAGRSASRGPPRRTGRARPARPPRRRARSWSRRRRRWRPGDMDFLGEFSSLSDPLARRWPLITPALFSHRTPPDREKREKLAKNTILLRAPSLPVGGSAVGERVGE